MDNYKPEKQTNGKWFVPTGKSKLSKFGYNFKTKTEALEYSQYLINRDNLKEIEKGIDKLLNIKKGEWAVISE